MMSKKKNNPDQQPSLMEQAKRLQKKKPEEPITGEKIELALGWVHGELSLATITRMITGVGSNGGSTSAYLFLARALRQWILDLEKTGAITHD